MGNVINFEKKQEEAIYNKLSALVAKNRREVEENPWPLINKQQDDIIRLHKAIGEIERILQPMQVHLETSYPIQPVDVGAEAIVQVMEVQDIIKKLGARLGLGQGL